MRIGVVGAGFIGRALAGHAMRTGHDVMISNSRHPRTLGSTVVALGCKAGTAAEAASFGEVVMLAVPFHAVADLPPDPFAGKVVVDVNNYYPQRDGRIEALDRHETTTSQIVAAHLPRARVVKAFNAILQSDLQSDARPPGEPDRRALPIASDDAEAKEVVAALQDQFGFDVVDAGGLAESWRFERAKPAYCVRLDVPGLRSALAAAQRTIELPHGSWRRG